MFRNILDIIHVCLFLFINYITIHIIIIMPHITIIIIINYIIMTAIHIIISYIIMTAIQITIDYIIIFLSFILIMIMLHS